MSRSPAAARARDEIAPGAVAQLLVLHFVQLGEAGRHTRLDGPLAKEARAEGMDGAGEEALEIGERGIDARRSRRLGPAEAGH